MKSNSYFLYVGGYTENSPSKGIHVYSMNRETGKLTLVSTHNECQNPTFIVIEPTRRFLYSVNELPDRAYMNAFAISAQDGTLSYLNSLDVPGSCMVKITTSADGRFVAAANYESGNVVTCSIRADGSIDALVSNHQHHGSSVASRQTKARAHDVVFDADNNFVIAADLGMDKLIIYQFNKETGELNRNSFQPEVTVNPGGGPRHLAFHPTGKWMYLVTELDNYIIGYDYDALNGALNPRQRVPLLPDNFTTENIAAEIQVTKDGRFLYASNRGFDMISGYRICPKTGDLSERTFYTSHGSGPRMFVFDTDNRFVIFANEYSNRVVVCRFNVQTGRILDKVYEVNVPRANCVATILPPGKD